MIHKLLFLISLIALTQAAYAEKPAACPNLTTIYAVGLEDVDFNGVWAGYIWRNNFNTPQDWRFVIDADEDKIKDKNNGVKEMNDSILKLTYINGPTETGDNSWTCAYLTDGISGLAWTLQ